MANAGVTVPIKVKLEGIAESIVGEIKKTEGILKETMSFLDVGRSILKADPNSLDANLKRRAYDKEMAKSGDEDLAKKAADAAGISNPQKEILGLLKDLSGVMKDFGNSLMGFVQSMFGVVEDIYKQMRKASPLLEMIENLFNLAMQLFFMPLGNKLAEVMLPAIINMVDAVMDIWDKFEGKTLGQMFSIAITEGVQLVASYLMDLGSLLEDEGGIVGAIGSLLSTIGDFLADDGAEIIGFLAKVFEFLMTNVGKLIVAAIEFFITSIAILSAIQLSLLAYFTQGVAQYIPGVSGIAPASAAAAGFFGVLGAGNAALFGTGLGGDLWNMAEGGYVPATPGGQIIRIAEAGEGEYVVPESKVERFIDEMMPSTPFEDVDVEPPVIAPIADTNLRDIEIPELMSFDPIEANVSELISMVPEVSESQEIITTNFAESVSNYETEIIPFNSAMTENIDNTTVTTGGVQTSNVTNNFYFEGLTNDDLRRIIKEEVDGMISQSKYRSGF